MDLFYTAKRFGMNLMPAQIFTADSHASKLSQALLVEVLSGL